jgi:hypothetical protein|tara:strand:- start:20928 stop:21194 length:267 start_codon:yes stop_codon:yes gene_type:complete
MPLVAINDAAIVPRRVKRSAVFFEYLSFRHAVSCGEKRREKMTGKCWKKKQFEYEWKCEWEALDNETDDQFEMSGGIWAGIKQMDVMP